MSEAPKTRFTTLILAAARAGKGTAGLGRRHKCMIEVNQVPMVQWVARALRASPGVGRIVVSIDDPSVLRGIPEIATALDDGSLSIVRSAASPAHSVLAAAAEIVDPYPLLVTTADSPLLTPDILGCFCTEALASKADVVAAVAPATLILREFPGIRRTFLRFRDERYSGCNLFAIIGPAGLKAVRFWCRVEKYRKRPWRLVAAFGVGSLVLFLMGRLTLSAAVRRLSARLAIHAHAVVVPVAAAAVDVDTASDLSLAEGFLKARGRSPVPGPDAVI